MRALMAFCAMLLLLSGASAPQATNAKKWTERFDVAGCEWSATGRNGYFVLEPGYQQSFEARGARLEITVLDAIEKIDGVDTRVVEEREWKSGELVEVSRNFFALCKPSGDVFYFGEGVDIYKNGRIVNHEGSWRAGKDRAKPGLFMPARPLLGARFYQEIAPGVAMDRLEIASDAEVVKTPAGEFHDAVKTEETTPLEPAVRDYKVYARGVGIVRDGEFLLTRYGHK